MSFADFGGGTDITMLRLVVTLDLIVSALSFNHTDCFNVFGEKTGIALANDGPDRTAMVEGFQYFGDADILLRDFELAYIDVGDKPNDKFPIPRDCFKIKKEKALNLEKDGDKTKFDLKKCQEGRSESDMLLICMTICRKKAGCTGAVYTGHDDGACQLYGGPNLEMPRCGYYPYRFSCSKRQKGVYLGIVCPADPLPSYVYRKRRTVAGPPFELKPQVYWIGGQLFLTDSSFENQVCKEDMEYPIPEYPEIKDFEEKMGKALMQVFENFGATRVLKIDCQKSQPTGQLNLNYWLVSDTKYDDVNKLREKIRSGKCDNQGVDQKCTSTFWNTVFAPAYQEQFGIIPGVEKASTDSTSTEAEKVGSNVGAMVGQPYEYRSCTDGNGQKVGFQFAEDFLGMVYNDVEFAPEQHAPVQPIYLSMRNPDAWFPIPEGCFNDVDTSGTKSNPALAAVGAHYELVDKVLDGIKYDCLGNRTEEEMIRICVEICRSINFHAGEPDAEEYNCIAINYDEHGGTKGHCHVYSPHDGKVQRYTTNSCQQISGINVGGVCASNRTYNLIDHGICNEFGVKVGKRCGRRNFLVIGCHFDPTWCLEKGKGYMDETSPCEVCQAGKYSYVDKKDWDPPWGSYSDLALIPHPEHMSGKLNRCKDCADGEDCPAEGGCEPHEIADGSCPRLCAPGRYGEKGKCYPCAAGRFAAENGSTACVECTPGYFQAEDGRSACEPCPAGKHQDERGKRVCLECVRGTYTEVVGQPECVSCPDSFTGFERGSSSGRDCICSEGKYYPCKPHKSCSVNLTTRLGLACMDCPKGYKCAGLSVDGMHVQPMLEKGMYALVEKPYEAYQCLVAAHLCLGGEPDTCGGGSFGLQCAFCKENEYMPRKGDCTPCEDGGSFFLAPLATILTLVAMLVLYKLTSKKVNRFESQRMRTISEPMENECDEDGAPSKGTERSSKQAEDRAVGSARMKTGATQGFTAGATAGSPMAATGPAAAGIFSQSIGVIVGSFQLFAIVALFDIDWPDAFKDLMNILMIFLFQVNLLRPSCFVGFSLAARYIPGVILPPFMCVLMFATYVFSVIGSKITMEWADGSYGCCPVTFPILRRCRIYRMDGDYALNTLGAILTGLYIAVCKCIINIFECRTNPGGEGTETMKTHDGFGCRDIDDIGPLLPIAILSILVFMVGLPGYLAWCLKVAPSRYHSEAVFRKQFEFFVSKWNPRWYFWGLVVLIRNLLVSMIAVVTPDPLEQLILVITFFAPVLALTFINAPWREEGLNWLDMFISSTLMITVVMAVALLPEPEDNTKDTIGAIMVLAFILGMVAASIILLDVGNIFFRGKTIFSQKPLEASFQAEFAATMLKIEVMHTLGEEALFRSIARFFSELPLADGKRVASAMNLIDSGLFGGGKPPFGIAPNPPRRGTTSLELANLAGEVKANFMEFDRRRESEKLTGQVSDKDAGAGGSNAGQPAAVDVSTSPAYEIKAVNTSASGSGAPMPIFREAQSAVAEEILNGDYNVDLDI